MNHKEQARRLKRAIKEAKVELLFGSECINESELVFRRDTLVGILTIAHQEMKALIENWTGEGLYQKCDDPLLHDISRGG